LPIDPQTQRRILGRFATGVTVITTRSEGALYGMTANAVTSLSLDPPLVLVAVDRGAQMHGYLSACRCFAINVLSEDQEQLSRRFATRGPKEFADLKTVTAESGAPILADALAWVDCRVADVLAGGDHEIFVGHILAGDARDGRPLLFYAGQYARLAEG
jgi:flavin reductase (DIM6/NTAB) family NADH-FMN oxidoreductase RutF